MRTDGSLNVTDLSRGNLLSYVLDRHQFVPIKFQDSSILARRAVITPYMKLGLTNDPITGSDVVFFNGD